MPLFKKPKKNLNLKKARTSDDEIDHSGAVASENNDISSSSSKTAVVSFAEDHEDGDEFKIKKSDRSIRVAKQLKKEYVKAKEETKLSKHELKQKHDADVILVGDDALHLSKNDDSADNSQSLDNSLTEIMKAGVIPDANMIHLIRKKRQLMRDTGVATGETVGNVAAPMRSEARREDKSALIREDDEADRSDMSDQELNDDSGGRLKMSVRQRQEEKRQKLRSTFLQTEQGSDQESDNDQEWEKQQISKGVSTMNVAEKQQAIDAFNEFPVGHRYVSASDLEKLADKAKKLSVSDVKRELQEHRSNLLETHRRHKFERQARLDSFDFSHEEIKACKERTDKIDFQYRFYQELHAYITDFIDCYNSMMPTILDLENRTNNMYKERGNRLTQRRRQDVVDQSLETSSSTKTPFENDEEMALRIGDRNNRRSRRRWNRQGTKTDRHYDGWSSDDEESLSEITTFNNERDIIRKGANELLSTISDDFVQLHSIISRFDGWRTNNTQSYRSAYGSLCLSKMLVPLVRVHIMDWNSLESSTSFMDHEWFKTLAGYTKISDVQSHTNFDGELSMLPSLIEKTVVYKVTQLVNNAWDPLSLKHTERLATLLESLVTTFPTLNADSKLSRELISAIVKRFREALDNDAFIPLCNKESLTDRNSKLSQFFFRQLWTCLKIFKSMSLFDKLISPEVLQDLMFTGLLNRYIALGLTQLDKPTEEVVDIYLTIMKTTPKVWFADLPPSQTTTIDKLKPFSMLLFQLVNRFTSRKVQREFASTASQFFITIHANDLASRIVSELDVQL